MSYIKLCTKSPHRMTVFVDMKIYTPEENKIDSCATFSYFLNLPHFFIKQCITVSRFPFTKIMRF